jgi:hypothetical protein
MVGTLIRAIREVCSNSSCNPRRIVPVLIDLRDLEGDQLLCLAPPRLPASSQAPTSVSRTAKGLGKASVRRRTNSNLFAFIVPN